MVDGFGNVTFRVNHSMLDDWEKGIPGRVFKMGEELAEETLDYIRGHWSPVSPSDPYRPPAVVTGTLDDSLYIEPVSQGFVKERGWAVRSSARYSAFLEEGMVKMAPRPYLGPAALTIADMRLVDKARKAFAVRLDYYD